MELGAVLDGYVAKLMLLLDSVGRKGANDVREEQNLSEI